MCIFAARNNKQRRLWQQQPQEDGDSNVFDEDYENVGGSGESGAVAE